MAPALFDTRGISGLGQLSNPPRLQRWPRWKRFLEPNSPGLSLGCASRLSRSDSKVRQAPPGRDSFSHHLPVRRGGCRATFQSLKPIQQGGREVGLRLLGCGC